MRGHSICFHYKIRKIISELFLLPFLFWSSGNDFPALELLASVKPLKRQTKIAADDILFFYFYLPEEIRLDVSCESSARQTHEISSLIFYEKQ